MLEAETSKFLSPALEVCEVMARVLLPKYINVPRKQHEVQGKIEGFKYFANIGAITAEAKNQNYT